MTTDIEATKTIVNAIEDAVYKAAKDPTNDLNLNDVRPVSASVIQNAAPIIANATNSEPFYQSRIYWGLFVSAVATIVKPFVGDLPIDEAQTADIVNALATAGQLAGLAFAAYGRYVGKASKPLGQ